jgi:hypothetical protein
VPITDIPKDRLFAYLLIGLVAVYVALATRAFDQPGIYMDAVNPDYLAARMLDPDIQTTAWVLPGNLLWKRWPLLAGGLYHGSIHAYLTLPFYFVLGGTVLSLRMAHLFLGIAVAVTAALFIWKITQSRVATFAAMLALVTDPSFIFTFRTQAYITTFPIVLILYGLGQLYAAGERRQKHLLITGLCVGLATWGYFIYAFMIPGILFFIAGDQRTRQLRVIPSIAFLLIGFGLGLLPYIIGYVSLFYRLGGMHQGLEWLRQAVSSLHVNSDQSYMARLEFVLRQIFESATGAWHWRTFFGTEPVGDYGQIAKLAVLTLLPLAAFPLAIQAGPWRRAFWFTGLPILSYVLVASVFGSRMGGHHFCLLLPLLYAVAAISLLLLVDRLRAWKGRAISFGLLCIGATVVNLTFFAAFISRLEAQGGAGLYSSVVSDYTARLRREGDRTPHVFMDWGGLLQFIYLTEGKITAYDGSQLHAVLCRYNGGNAVFLGADALKRGLQAMENDNLTVTDVEQSSTAAQNDFQFVVLKVIPTPAYCR